VCAELLCMRGARVEAGADGCRRATAASLAAHGSGATHRPTGARKLNGGQVGALLR
jgi:hypothetical protein